MASDAQSRKPSRAVAIFEALAVVAIWGSSFIFIKIGLDHAGPLTLAGLRYFAAFLILLPFTLGRNRQRLPRSIWVRLALIGLCAYTIGNGSLFWGLKYLPATTSSFLMSLIPLLVLALSIFWLREFPTAIQVIGLIISLAGCALFFAPGLRSGEPLGLAITGIGLVGFALFGILGREIARVQAVGTVVLTAYPLGFGGAALLILARFVEGPLQITPAGIGIVLWLALVNTALAYLLYNHALQSLTALEMNLLLNLAPFATALIAVLVLAEVLQPVQYIAMTIAIAGAGLAQWRKSAAKQIPLQPRE